MTCAHCGKPVKRSYSKYNNGWTHEGGDVYCRKNIADVRSPDPEMSEAETRVTNHA